MSDRVPMTPEGHRRLKEKLKRLKTVNRPKNIVAIEEARDHGDLSENAEYDAAKEEQGKIEAMIRDIEDKLARAQIIDPATITSEKIVFGASVTLSDIESGETLTYRIVGIDEADINNGSISIDSPIARALIGKGEGDEARVRTPGGVRELEIISICYKAT